MTSKVLNYGLPIGFIVTMLTIMVTYSIYSTKRRIAEEYYLEAYGVIFSIRNAGKGSKDLLLKRHKKPDEHVYVLGLGPNDDDIFVGDSLSKSPRHLFYYIYRKYAGKDSLVYMKPIFGAESYE